ncbi:hypothetical protein GCM10011344_41820 [Dokdonia pacifica]|uniref:Uncharacterized protein n=1 Tax=Dokdonia pacifica TaxID=1627892 RepID=A0A239DI08_9FLAO|nr:hypothetical protein [Dokdonia pacifica]GGG36621.1 hypothetical protein GCM10011344_41820 [Dokdonia pacifica]SNS32076.1 hypothetical protein SAMN06265376_11129 [Dokdonia pacifica]
MKKRKLSTLQIVTIAFIVLFLIWERNIQLYLSEHDLQNSLQTRKDLFVSLPILLVLIVASVRQWKKNTTSN